MTSSVMPSAAQSRHRVALASLAGIGINRPPANAALARRTSGSEVTGVVDRVRAEQGVTTASLAAGAARAALQAAGVDGSAIGMIVVATATPDVLWPSTACLVQTDLGLPAVAAFDLYDAQAGLLTALTVAGHYVAGGVTALVIGAECERQLVDLTGQGARVHARAASAAVVKAGTETGGILATVSGGAARPGINGETEDDVLLGGLDEAVRECLRRAGRTVDEVNLVVADQSSPQVMRTWSQRQGVRDDRLLLAPDRYGSLLAAAPFMVLHDAVREGRLRDGMTVLLLQCGSGPVWGAACVEWGQTGVGQC